MLTCMWLSITHWHGTSLPLSQFLSAVRQWVCMMSWVVLCQRRYFNFVSFSYFFPTCQFSLTGFYFLLKLDFPTCPSRVIFACLLSQQRDFLYSPKGLTALVVCLLCPLHVCCVWPGAVLLTLFLFLWKNTVSNKFFYVEALPYNWQPCLYNWQIALGREKKRIKKCRS